MEKLNLINRLVRESFGFGFKGNYDLDCLYSSEIDEPLIIQKNRLEGILRRWWLPIPNFFEFIDYAGRFVTSDGSKLEIGKKYREAANKYAELYEKEFGKKVEIILA